MNLSSFLSVFAYLFPFFSFFSSFSISCAFYFAYSYLLFFLLFSLSCSFSFFLAPTCFTNTSPSPQVNTTISIRSTGNVTWPETVSATVFFGAEKEKVSSISFAAFSTPSQLGSAFLSLASSQVYLGGVGWKMIVIYVCFLGSVGNQSR